MNEQELPVVDDEWPALQPAQELVAIGRLEDRRDGVVPVRLRVPGRDGQQVEIVVAEDGDGGNRPAPSLRAAPRATRGRG